MGTMDIKEGLKTAIAVIVVLGLSLGAVYLLYLFTIQFAVWFAKLDTLVQAAFIAVGGAVLTAITALSIKRIENKHAVDAQFRKDKADLFLEFMKAFDDLQASERNKRNKRGDNLLNLLKDFQRKSILWCSVRTMKKFDELKDFASSHADDETQTVDWLGTSLRLYGELVLTMRKDLGLSCRGLDKETFGLRHVLRNPDLLSAAMKENPNMTVDELTQREQGLPQ